jgi:hypothetical protein
VSVLDLVRMMEQFRAHRLGELRVLDLRAQGIDLDLDQDQLVELGMAPDHEDILAKLRIPDKWLEPICAEDHWSRVLPNGRPSAVASRGQVEGQAIIDGARREADQVRRALVELARVKVTGEADELAASLPPYDPDDPWPWHDAMDQLLDQLLHPDQDQVQDLDPNPALVTMPELHPETAEDSRHGQNGQH